MADGTVSYFPRTEHNAWLNVSISCTNYVWQVTMQPAAPVLLLPSRSSSDVEIKEYKRVGLQRRTCDLSSWQYFVCVCVCGRDIRRILFYQYDNICEDFSILVLVMLPVTSL
jgi:hypothetical protein